MTRALALSCALLVCGCDRPPGSGTVSSGTVSSAPEPRARAAAPALEAIERASAGAALDAELPLLVLLHGRGSTPESFVAPFEALDRPARLLAIRAPIDEGEGRAWFTFREGGAAAIAALDALVAPAFATIETARGARPTRGRPIVLGFSQGGMLAYALAFAHPESFSLVVPVSAVVLGRPPAALPAGLAPIAAFHGTTDEIIPLDAHQTDVAALTRAGARITLTPIEGATHWIGEPMRAAIFATLRDAPVE